MIFLNKIFYYCIQFIIFIYRIFFSVTAGRQCRFEPTCSQYTLEVFKHYHFIKAFILTGKRLWNCSPFSHYRHGWHYDSPLKYLDKNNDDKSK
jgi:putative membrane protein insertion efficiency factor